MQTLFPSSNLEVHEPNELSDVVQLVTEWPGRALALDHVSRLQVTSAPNVTPVLDVITAAQDEWIEVMYGDVSHDSATDRAIQAVMLIAGQNFFLARWTAFASVLLAGQPSGFEPLFASSIGANSGVVASERILHRQPLYIPPQATWRFFGNTAGAAYSISVGFIFARHPMPERPVF